MNSEMTTDNMSNEEVIEVLKGIVFNGFDRTTRKERQALDLAIKALEERPQGEWIPVSEGLPNTLGVYNVTRKLIEGETIYFISDASYFDGQNTWHRDTGINHGRPYLTDVIAWMPRPEPYKDGGKKE